MSNLPRCNGDYKVECRIRDLPATTRPIRESVISPQHPDAGHLVRGLSKCIELAIPWVGVLYRSASPHAANKDDILTGAGSKAAGGRWNSPGICHVVYTSLDPETSLAECLAYYHYHVLPVSKAMPRVMVSLEAQLRNVLNLTDGTICRRLGVSRHRLLAGVWRDEQDKWGEAFTQVIGRLAYDANLEGLLVPSAARMGGQNLIIFPANLHPPESWLRVINKEQLPPSY